MTNNLTRRALFAATPAAGIAMMATPSRADAGLGDTPILRLFREWEATFEVANDLNNSQEFLDAAVARLTSLEGEILSLTSTCAADFAAKLISYTDYGGFDLDSNQEGELIWAEAYALTGRPSA